MSNSIVTAYLAKVSNGKTAKALSDREASEGDPFELVSSFGRTDGPSLVDASTAPSCYRACSPPTSKSQLPERCMF